jgi:hypothetical protein
VPFSKQYMRGIRKWLELTSFAATVLPIGWILSNCLLNIFSPKLYTAAIFLGASRWLHETTLPRYWGGQPPVPIPCHRLRFVPSWSHYCVQVHFHKLQITDYWISDGLTPSFHRKRVVSLCQWSSPPILQSFSAPFEHYTS